VRKLLLALCCCALLSACRVDADVQITMHDDGSGTVAVTMTIDAEAVANVEQNGRTLESAVLLDDFRDAGWEVGEWRRANDGGASIVLTREFTGEAQLSARLAELGGSSDVMGSPRVIHERSFLRARDELSVAADLRGLAATIAADEELSATLTAAGLDPATLEQQLTTQLQDSFHLTVGVELPDGRSEEIQLRSGDQQRVTAAHKTFHASRVAALAGVALLGFLALLLYLSASVSARHDRQRRQEAAARRQPKQPPLM
jgi:hypothetical protein